MNEMTTTNLSRLATEINSIKEQTRKIVISASIEIGRRLKEAKSMVEHGNWGEWLETNVDYSQRTANNLVRIYDEYGSDQVNFLGDSNSQALANLTYTQAVALLGIPKDEREEFVQENNMDAMSTRELEEAIKAKNSAEKKLEREQQQKKEISMDLHRAENSIVTLKAQVEEFEQQDGPVDTDELQAVQTALKDEVRKVQDLQAKLQEKPKEVIKEVVPENMKRQMEELKAKATSNESPLMIKYKLQFKELIDGIKDLKDTMADVYSSDGTEGDKCKKALTNLMNRTLEEIG